MHAFLLAGGFATRLWPLTERRPKPLLPLAGKPMLTHLLEKIPGDMPVTVSTNAAFENEFRTWVSAQNRPIDLIIEDTRKDDHKLGALGAVAQWIEQKKIRDDVLVLTGDNYLGFALTEFLATYQRNPLLAAHDIKELAKASAFGTVITDPSPNPSPSPISPLPRTHRVRSFEEKPKNPRSTLVSAGCFVLPSSTLPILITYAKDHPDNIGSIFEEYLHRGLAVDCFTFTEAWMDVGSFGSYLDAHRFLIGDNALNHPTARITATTLTGSVTVGNGSTVSNSELTDCMIFDNCTIDDCVLRDCIIDDNCVLQGVDLTGKMIRAGTKLVSSL